MLSIEDADVVVVERLGRWERRLVEIAHDIHAHPETNFGEHHAHDALVALLSDAGFDVEPHAYGVDTAFVARAGEGSGPTVAILCEYDALAGIGHACGHNVIAAAGAGAGILAAGVVDELGGRLVVIGTPAEEGGGGKVDLLEAGAFDAVDVALMVHPADADLTRMDTIAVAQYRVAYRGVAAHAAAAPERGRNALDAAVLGYLNVAALRQHIGSDERIHGIFTRAGDAANVVPAEAEALWYVRSPSLPGLAALTERVHACLRAGASAAGCDIEIEPEGHVYADMIDNPLLVERYVARAARCGRTVEDPGPENRVVGSTDMGNVSHRVPSIHPMLGIAPKGTAIHTVAFADAAASSAADLGILDASVTLARIALDCWADPDLVRRARDAWASAIPSAAPGAI
ncbi:MAG: amidohydrolase [Actinobacteria bacterium]|nr:amidohydrolase [Actinomycetota bacterium]